MKTQTVDAPTFPVIQATDISPNLTTDDGFLFAARDEADGSVWLYRSDPQLMNDGRWVVEDESDAGLLPFDVPGVATGKLYCLAFG